MPPTYTEFIYRPMKIVGTNITNLVRDGDSGIYYARIKFRGKICLRSLGEDCTTREKARLRLDDKIEEIKKGAEHRPTQPLGPNATMGEAVAIYRKQVALMDLSEATKEFRLRPTDRANINWPGLYERTLKSIHAEEVQQMFADLRADKVPYAPPHSKGKTIAGNSPTVINAILAFL